MCIMHIVGKHGESEAEDKTPGQESTPVYDALVAEKPEVLSAQDKQERPAKD